VSPGNANLRRRSEMKYARRRTASSEGSSGTGVTSARGDGEMCAVCLLETFVPLGLRGVFAVATRGGVCRLPVFFVAAGAAESGEG